MYFKRLKQTFRLLFKERRITLINITGLSISLACALFMLLWVEHELSYDRFHKDFKQLFRVEEDQYYSNAEPYLMFRDRSGKMKCQRLLSSAGWPTAEDNFSPTKRISSLRMEFWPLIPPSSKCSPSPLSMETKRVY